MKSKVVLFIALGFSVAIVHLMIYANTASVGYKADGLKKELSALRSGNRSLAAEAAKKESLDRVENIAKTQLKMITPERIKYIVVTEESR